MGGTYWIIAAVIFAVGTFFMFTNWRTRRTHARFQRQDVLDAISEMVSEDSKNHDLWDLFLAWPMDDQYLESVRQRCLAIVEGFPPTKTTEDISSEGLAKVRSVLDEIASV